MIIIFYKLTQCEKMIMMMTITVRTKPKTKVFMKKENGGTENYNRFDFIYIFLQLWNMLFGSVFFFMLMEEGEKIMLW